VITGEALRAIIQQLLCHGYAPKATLPPSCTLSNFQQLSPQERA
jgi:hypothetical protein